MGLLLRRSSFLTWFLSLLVCHGSFGKVVPCSSAVANQVCKAGDPLQDYLSTPLPLPALVNITVNVIDILKVNEETQTVQLQLKLVIEWFDDRLDVIRSAEDIAK